MTTRQDNEHPPALISKDSPDFIPRLGGLPEYYMKIPNGRDIPDDPLQGTRPYLFHWLKAFDAHPTWAGTRFKFPGGNRHTFGGLPKQRIDLVNEEELLVSEPDRLPLFLGHSFGLGPRDALDLLRPKRQLIAIFAKSLLSGCVSGLSIYLLHEHGMEQIWFFDNSKQTGE